jgi:propanol-preferring alcohol dehydrogenase
VAAEQHNVAKTMRAWEVAAPAPIADHPLRLVERAVPEPGPGEVRIRVVVCGVCRTDLHLAEGDLPPRRAGTVPGHEVVGHIDKLGEGSRRFVTGERVGAAWLASACGVCEYCLSGRENLCLAPRFTGWDIDGGFAEYMVADERFIYRLPAGFDDEAVAPLLCAGIIGYRALARSELPAGGRLGLYGFGGSAHLTAQVALAQGGTVHVITRSDEDQALARELSVTANTRSDGEEFLATADRIGIRPTTRPYVFEDVDKALYDLAYDRFSGAAVILTNR